jgi:hypothetical protein
MSNYKSAIDRINKAQTVEELHKVSEGLERVYRWGQLTDSEYMRLDGKLCDRINLLSWQRLRAEHPAIERARP